MFTSLTQRIVFVAGLLILAYIGMSWIMEALTNKASGESFNFLAILLPPAPVLIVWHFTGVLKPVIKWFSGTKT